jgi:hypothetical protein
MKNHFWMTCTKSSKHQHIGQGRAANGRTGNDVKKTRRVEIQIERREISLFSGPAAGASQSQAAAAEIIRGAERPAACPSCGSPNLLLLAEAVASGELQKVSLQSMIDAGSFHLHCSAAGEWWVCAPSIHSG